MKATISVLIVLVLAVPASAAATRGKQSATRASEVKAAPLLAVLAIERESEAYYRAVLDRNRPFHPFGMIYRVEQRHEKTLVEELKQHNLAVPEDQTPRQAVDVPGDKGEALAKAVELERKTVAAYEKAIKKIRDAEPRKTLQQLRAESADHQKWFANPDTCPMGGRGRGRNVR